MSKLMLGKIDLKHLKDLRVELNAGDSANQSRITEIQYTLQDFKEELLPNEKDEVLRLVDPDGNDRNLRAPRWLCHLLGLRHRSIHIILQWQSPSLGKVFILQVRSWNKFDSPGQLDISVGGHVVIDTDKLKAAYREMEEELGITIEHLKNGELTYQKGYKVLEEQEEKNFYNTEWRDIYIGEISTESLNQIRFNDNEVVGLYLCPESQAQHLLNQKIIPMASALRDSLQLCI